METVLFKISLIVFLLLQIRLSNGYASSGIRVATEQSVFTLNYTIKTIEFYLVISLKMENVYGHCRSSFRK